MKRVMKKVLTAALVIGVISSVSISSALASEVVVGSDSLSNEYIKVWNLSGDYSLDTTGGEPDLDTDNEKRLLYHGTSRMFGSVDGTVKAIYPSISTDETSKSILGEYEFGGVKFKQVLTIIKNNTTNREDIVEFKLIATNEDTKSHNVGSRIMLDTMLGSNDYAPFRLSNVGEVTKRIQFEGNEIPALYQAFDDLSEPTVIGTGSFATGVYKPDIVQFTNWPKSTSNVLVPDCDTEASLGDSAVNSIWQEKALDAGETRVYKAYYGLGKIVTNNESSLVLGMTKINPDFEINEDGTGYNPVSIMGYIQNNGDINLNDVILSISLPDELTLSEGEQSIDIGSLDVEKTSQATWTINAKPSYVEKEVEITINAVSAETGEVTPIKCTYTIPALEEPATEPPTVAPTEVPTVVPTEATTGATSPTEATASATNPTVAPTTSATNSTVAPTTNATNSTVAPTTSATNSTVAPTQAPTTISNTQVGKVATGDGPSIVPTLVALMGASCLLSIVTRKNREK